MFTRSFLPKLLNYLVHQVGKDSRVADTHIDTILLSISTERYHARPIVATQLHVLGDTSRRCVGLAHVVDQVASLPRFRIERVVKLFTLRNVKAR